MKAKESLSKLIVCALCALKGEKGSLGDTRFHHSPLIPYHTNPYYKHPSPSYVNANVYEQKKSHWCRFVTLSARFDAQCSDVSLCLWAEILFAGKRKRWQTQAAVHKMIVSSQTLHLTLSVDAALLYYYCQSNECVNRWKGMSWQYEVMQQKFLISGPRQTASNYHWSPLLGEHWPSWVRHIVEQQSACDLHW